MAELACLLKVSDNAEPYYTHFDMLTGQLVDGFDWFADLNMEKLFEYDPVQKLNGVISNDILYDILFKYKNSRLLINGAATEFILVTANCISKYDTEGMGIAPPLYNLDESMVRIPFKETGCVLSPCFTFNVIHPAFKIAACTMGGRVYVMTRFGLRDVTGMHDDILDADDSVKITPAKLLDRGEEVYAGYSVKGVVKYIYYKEVDVW